MSNSKPGPYSFKEEQWWTLNKEEEKSRAPIKLIAIGDINSTSVYEVSITSHAGLVARTEIEPHTATASQPQECTEK